MAHALSKMTGTQIKKWRKRLGLSQQGAADALGVAKDTYRNWEYGRRGISVPIEKLCAVIEQQRKGAAA